MSTVQYNNEKNQLTKRVYFTGTDVLQEGYNLCYDFSVTTTDFGPLPTDRILKVKKPATAVLAHYAGVVSQQSAGLKGPCWCTIIQPCEGNTVKAYTKIDTSSSGLGTAGLKLTDNDYALVAVTTGATQVAIALEAADTSTTEAAKLVRFNKAVGA